MIVLDFIILTLAILTSLLFIMSIIGDIVSSSSFTMPGENSQHEVHAKYRLVLSFIMSFSWAYVILLI
jgi:hypothetical protein